jgi:hypothetical protein
MARSLNARTASRHDADVLFDWDDPTTRARAMNGVDRVLPVMRVTYAGPVSDFLNRAAKRKSVTFTRRLAFCSTGPSEGPGQPHSRRRESRAADEPTIRELAAFHRRSNESLRTYFLFISFRSI